MKSKNLVIALAWLTPFMMAARGEGCGGSETDGETTEQITPDVTGDWSLAWEDNLDVEITIGGATYTESLGAQGGIVAIDHNGTPITFDLDCSREVVVCPSEVWPSSVSFDQRDELFPRNVYVTIPFHECSGELVDVDPSECGPEAESCQQCDGETTLNEVETFGRIALTDDRLDVFLNAGVASNGVNCALLGLSFATADLETTGAKETGDWEAVSMPNGSVVTGYAGGCLWAGDVDDDGTVEALAVGAAVKLTTNFTGSRN